MNKVVSRERSSRGPGRRSRAWIAATCAAALGALVLSACGGGSGDKSSTINFRLDYSPWGGEAPLFMAQELGYYEDAGLDVKLQPGKGSGATTQSVFAGHDDMGHAFLQTAIMSIDKGAKGRVVGTMSNASGNGFFVDESVNSLEDLYGKTIGVAPSTGSEWVLPALFGLNDLDLDKVKIERTEVGTLNAIYGQNKVDGILQEVAYGNPMVQRVRPSNVLRYKDIGFPLVHYGILVNQKMLDERPEDVRKFLEATAKGYEAAVEDPEAAAKAVTKHADQLEYEDILDQWEESIKIRYTESTEGLPALCSNDETWGESLALLSQYAGLKSDPKDIEKFYTQEYLDCE